MICFLKEKSAQACVLAVWLFWCVWLSTGVSGAQTIIHVPQDQPSIQAGINAANNGDTVLVSPGSYTEQLNFNGKAVTVTTGATSYSDPQVAATIINATPNTQGYGLNPIANFLSGERRGTVLNGFTIVSPTQDYFYVNTVVITGYAEVSALNSLDTFSLNPIPLGQAGTPTISNNRFIGVASPIGLSGGVIAGNYFSGCTGISVMTVGGFAEQPGVPDSDIHDNVIENNKLTGGIELTGSFLYAEHALVHNNIFRDNTAPTHGTGGIGAQPTPGIGFVLNEPFVFAQNLVTGNQMDLQFSITLGTATGVNEIFSNNTIADNFPSPLCTQPCSTHQLLFTKSGAYQGNAFILANNIMRAGPGAGPTITCMDDGRGPYLPAMSDTLQVDHNLFAPSSQPVFDASCRPQIVNAGNLVADPQFLAPANGNDQLAPGSPAVDAGNDSILAELNTFSDPLLAFPLTSDLAGQPRPMDATGRGYPVLDMGAYELAGAQDSPPTGLVLIPSSYAPVVTTQTTLTADLSSALGVPTGSVTLTDNGNPRGTATIQANGTAVFNVTALTNGIHEFIANYAGNQTFPPTTSVKLVLPFEPIGTYLELLASPATAPIGTAVTLYVTAGARDITIPTPVTLTDNGQALGTVSPDANGYASLVVSTFTVGTHTIVASYAGGGKYSAASVSATVTIESNDFAISLNPPTVTVASGQQGRTSVVLTSLGVFAGSLNLTAEAAPQYGTLAFASKTVSFTAGGSASSLLTIDTAEVNGRPVSRLEGCSAGTALTWAALLALPLGWKRRRRWRMGLTMFVAGVLLMTATGCTTIAYPVNRVAPGTYVVPITATDPGTQIAHSVNLTLVVTP